MSCVPELLGGDSICDHDSYYYYWDVMYFIQDLPTLLACLIIKQVSQVYLLYHIMWYPLLSRHLVLIEPHG